jgi:methanogen homocitrate synthase
MSATIRPRLTPLNALLEDQIGKRPMLCDVTLRDGEQSVDVAFTDEEKLQVIEELERCHLPQIQVGFVKTGAQIVKRAKRNGVLTSLELLCLTTSADWREQIDIACDSGADVIHFLVRGADEILRLTGISREEARDQTVACVSRARELGVERVVFGPSFTTQSDKNFLKQLYLAAIESGASELMINDSIGIARPAAIAFLVKQVRDFTDLPVGVHCHNDFGLATACSLAGIEAGASRADVCVNGFGERAGNTPLEDLCVALEYLYGVNTGIKIEGLTHLSRTVARILKLQISNSRPVVGLNSFAQQLDMHIELARHLPGLVEPYEPSSVGNERYVRLGKGSGPIAVAYKLAAYNFPTESWLIRELVQFVNSEAEKTKSFIPDETFCMMAQTLTGALDNTN